VGWMVDGDWLELVVTCLPSNSKFHLLLLDTTQPTPLIYRFSSLLNLLHPERLLNARR
jgi:hypothetical protein